MTVAPDIPPRPPVVRWFGIYAAFMAVLYAVVAAVGLVLFIADPADVEGDRFEQVITAGVLVGIGGMLFIAFAAALFVPRAPWTWVYDLALIALGFTSCLTLPATIPLLIFWLKPEAKVYFGRDPRR